MKRCLNAWAVESSADFEKTFRAVSSAGFEGIELNFDPPGKSAHSLTLDSSNETFELINELSDRFSLPVVSVSSSLGWTYHIGNRADRDMAKRAFESQLEAAVRLGASGILTLPDGVPENGSLLLAREASLEFYESEKSYIDDCGLTVGVENVWNGFFGSPFDMKEFIKDTKNPHIKAYFDAGNVFAFSQPEHWIEILAGDIGFVHVKGYRRNRGMNSGGEFCGITDGGINWSAVMSALNKAEYNGTVTAEVVKRDAGADYSSFYSFVKSELDRIIAE